MLANSQRLRPVRGSAQVALQAQQPGSSLPDAKEPVPNLLCSCCLVIITAIVFTPPRTQGLWRCQRLQLGFSRAPGLPTASSRLGRGIKDNGLVGGPCRQAVHLWVGAREAEPCVAVCPENGDLAALHVCWLQGDLEGSAVSHCSPKWCKHTFETIVS